ncbi:hypothetical protein A2U01_0072881, partial [Trifolium medium]|nr:hypothetical protein [Trifolium medium]
AGSMMGSESGPYNPGQQLSVGKKNMVIPSPSCDVAHRESQASPSHNLNSGAAEGCKVEPDAASTAVLEVVAVVLLLLHVLPLNLSLPS